MTDIQQPTKPFEGKFRSRLFQLLHKHPVLFLGILLFTGMTIILFHLNRLSTDIKESTSLEAASRYSAALQEFRDFYASEIVPRAEAAGVEVTPDYQSKHAAIPIPATLSIELGRQISAKRTGTEVRVISDYPFPWRKPGHHLDQFEMDALKAFREQTSSRYYRFEQYNGSLALRFALPALLKPTCVGCHNTHPQSPKTDWKVGDVRGVQEVIVPLGREASQIRSGLIESFLIMMTITLIGLGILWVVIGGFRRSVQQTNELVEKQIAINSELETQIAERQKAEESSLLSKVRLQHLLTSSSAVIFSLTPTVPYRLTYISENAESILGYPATEFMSSREFWLEKIHEEDRAIFNDEMEPVFRNGSSSRDYRVRQSNGVYRWIHSDLRIVADDQGKPLEIVGSAVDITQVKLIEEQVSQYNKTLEENVEKRTHELIEKNDELEKAVNQLKDTQQQLIMREKLASLGELTAAISHEIKNPLNFINNFANLSVMQVDQLQTEIAPYTEKMPVEDKTFFEGLIQNLVTNLDKIKEHGGRADSIVKGMLLHSRGISDGFAEMNVNEILHEYVFLAYHSMRAQDPNFNVTIEEEYEKSLPTIMGSSQDLSRVFLNIVNNAFYATNEKRQKLGEEYLPLFVVKTRKLEDRVEVRLRDNGSGIPDHVRQKMFEPFFTTKPSGKGTGLGLSISYEVVKQHAGEIIVDTKAGEYTEFIITLPIQQDGNA